MYHDKLILPEDEICSKYLKGKTMIQLGNEYGCSTSSISNILKRSHVKSRSFRDAALIGWNLELPSQEIIDLYNSGISSTNIGKKYNCSPGTILTLLKKNSVKIRSLSDAIRLKLPDKEIVELYNSGLSMSKLGEKYGCSSPSIGFCLKRNNVKIRSLSEESLLVHRNNPDLRKRQSAIQMNQDYDGGEWTGFHDDGRPYLKPENECIKLNQRMEGDVGHHLLPGVIVYGSEYIHKSIFHIMPHDSMGGCNMKEVNNEMIKILLRGI